MIQTILFSMLLIFFLYILIKSSDYLVECATIIGKKLNISYFIIGLTIVAIGTSLPELVSVVFGLLFSSTGGEFLTGTIIGSNIANSLLIMSALVLFLHVKLDYLSIQNIVFLTISTVSFSLLLYFNMINVTISKLFIILFFSYVYLLVISKQSTSSQNSELEEELNEHIEHTWLEKQQLSVVVAILVFAAIVLSLSARGIVFSIDELAQLFSIPQFILTFTTLALATSLPEMAVTIQSVRKEQYNLAFGNIIGSNISNILLIGGIGMMIATIQNISITIDLLSISSLFLSLILLLLTTLLSSPKRNKFIAGILFVVYIIIIIVSIVGV
ncbi:MAG: sodium:calcium antiporter [Candidatus Nanoarchaeia archaeon]